MGIGFKAAVTAAMLVSSAGVAAASQVTFDFRSGGNTGGNIPFAFTPFPPVPLVIDGIGIQANAGRYNGETESDVQQNDPLRGINKNGNGLGVCYPFPCVGEIDGDNAFGFNPANDDLLTLMFNQTVFFKEVLFTEVDLQDEVDIFVDGMLVFANELISSENPLDLTGFSGTSISFGAERQTPSNLNEDDFRVGYLTVSDMQPIPVPAALPLLVAGLGALGVTRRRRRA
jgi:hypothetical protein